MFISLNEDMVEYILRGFAYAGAYRANFPDP
jgi:hypothetical protein